jgi:hypothetical protein
LASINRNREAVYAAVWMRNGQRHYSLECDTQCIAATLSDSAVTAGRIGLILSGL